MPDWNALFYEDAYINEFDSEVVSCTEGKNGYETVLKRTAFYPEGGGQPADHGFLNDTEVTDVQYRGEQIVHITNQPLCPGETVHGKIDWDRRFDFMQNHSGEHIFSGIVHRMFGYENVGFHMGGIIQIDFDGPLNAQQIRQVELEANRIIQKDIPVEELYPSARELADIDYRSKKELEGKVRIVRIENADVCACCGTHVRKTGEIGMVKVLRHQKHKKGVRIEIVSGMRAFRIIAKIMDENHAVSEALSAPLDDTFAAVERLLKDNGEKQQIIQEKTLTHLLYKIRELPHDVPLVCAFEEALDRTAMRKYGNALLEECNALAAAVFSFENERWNYFIISHAADLRPVAAQLSSQCNGRGGGSAEMVQGSVSASKEEIERLLKNMPAFSCENGNEPG